jgi:hypothetical protein
MVELGIPTKLVRLMMMCVQKSKYKIKFNSIILEEFLVKTGLRHGDALSPILFNQESVVRKVQKDNIALKIGEQNMVIAPYPNDLIIIGETEDQVKNTEKNLILEGKNKGLSVNEDTKYLIVSWRKNHFQ